jgi:hypothetical protein
MINTTTKCDTKYVGKPVSGYVKGKITYNPNHPDFRAFEYLKSISPAGTIPKVVIPSPNFLIVFRDWKTDKWPSYV